MAARDHIARHTEYKDTMDLIPTPPFATRALFDSVLSKYYTEDDYDKMSAWDPACGFGHMCEVFKEMGFNEVISSDVKDHGYDPTMVIDFCGDTAIRADLIITNPPYAKMNSFIINALDRANMGVAMLTRIQMLEGQSRYNNIFKTKPPSDVAVFSDRIPFKVGEVVPKASKMFTHCWAYWDKTRSSKSQTTLTWIRPTIQKELERPEDYAASDD